MAFKPLMALGALGTVNHGAAYGVTGDSLDHGNGMTGSCGGNAVGTGSLGKVALQCNGTQGGADREAGSIGSAVDGGGVVTAGIRTGQGTLGAADQVGN